MFPFKQAIIDDNIVVSPKGPIETPWPVDSATLRGLDKIQYDRVQPFGVLSSIPSEGVLMGDDDAKEASCTDSESDADLESSKSSCKLDEIQSGLFERN